jgi:hypothetical protein
MSNLDPRIEAVRKEYDLERSDFWQIPQNKQWVCKHSALEVVAVKAGVEWSAPQIIEANAPGLVTSMIVTGKLGERVEWATGETNPTNYHVKGKQPAYPWAMSEKRAKDRVILKLVGIHGLVYSEDEISEPVQAQEPKEPAPQPVSAAKMKVGLKGIDYDLIDCNSILKVDECAAEWKATAKKEGWTEDYQKEAAKKFQTRRDQINAAEDQPANDETETGEAA